MRRIIAAVTAAGCLLLGACAGGNDPPASRTHYRILVINDTLTDICLAVAESLAEQVAGLSHRQSLPPKEGMAFIFGDADTRAFTMRDTSFPLAIVWVGRDDKVLGSTALTPNDVTRKASPGPILIAVEMRPEDWNPIAATARTLTLGHGCDGTVTAGRPGTSPKEF